MGVDVRGLHEVGRADVGAVGGKGANLGELSRLDGVQVPAGFCVTTDAFARVVTPTIAAPLDRLARLGPEDHEERRALAATIRGDIERIELPGGLRQAISRALTALGEQAAYAVRSSATAEDLPGASFAGQQDTFLDVVGEPAILAHLRRCWASLYTERAVAYRDRNGFDARGVRMAVVVQRMLSPRAAGVLFTADPVSGNRKVTCIDGTLGLGEALVSGHVDADGYRVRDDLVVGRRGDLRVLDDEQITRLARLGRRIEAHFGQPQDIEWCLVDDEFHVVQSRPITTLFPIPETTEPGNRVYISVGHQQMMTDPLRPLGLSLFQSTALRPMYAAGGRLFVDVTRELASPASRAMLLGGLGRHDPLIEDAVRTLLDRGDFCETVEPVAPGPGGPPAAPQLEDDPAIVADLVARNRASVEALERDIQGRTGADLLDFILEDVGRLKQLMTDPRSFAATMAGFLASTWINAQMMAWLGEKNAADVLSQSAPGNVTSEMGLALLDVADVIRPYPQVIAWLQQAQDDAFWEGLLPLEGGREAHDALRGWLDRYGMRCAGEIDVTRTRWSEAPTTLVPLILANLRNFEPGAGGRRFESGRREAARKEEDLLSRLGELPDGEEKAAQARRMIHRLRTFVGYREYPKYGLVCRYFVYRRALLGEAERLVRAGVLGEREDMGFLTWAELREVVCTQAVDPRLIQARKAEHERHRRLTPPRVLTSDGEVVTGAYRRGELPAGALVGLPVSAGVVEGRARVLTDMADAQLEEGDILVTAFTDPSWTPLFVCIRALVTEVGGLMTHGAVIAREYGLPAVIGVVDATRLIKDGQRIRVNGTEGYVEIVG